MLNGVVNQSELQVLIQCIHENEVIFQEIIRYMLIKLKLQYDKHHNHQKVKSLNIGQFKNGILVVIALKIQMNLSIHEEDLLSRKTTLMMQSQTKRIINTLILYNYVQYIQIQKMLPQLQSHIVLTMIENENVIIRLKLIIIYQLMKNGIFLHDSQENDIHLMDGIRNQMVVEIHLLETKKFELIMQMLQIYYMLNGS